MAIVLAGHSNEPIDLLKAIKMLLIHDVVEIDSGDIFLYDSVVSHSNTEAETIAARRIFGLLPADQTEALIAIWEDLKPEKPLKLSSPVRWTALNRCSKTGLITEAPGKSST